MMLVADGGKLRQMIPESEERCQKCQLCRFDGNPRDQGTHINRCTKSGVLCDNVVKTFDIKKDVEMLAAKRRLIC